MSLGLEWTGRVFSDKIDELAHALDVVETHLRQCGHEPAELYRKVLAESENNHQIGPATSAWLEAEMLFADIAFMGWHTVPDNWSLTA